ncbi:MAG: radical SAM protein [bacterium]|nr:radical SAM protein [bacterium]
MKIKDFYNDILGSAGLSIPVVLRVMRSAGFTRTLSLVLKFVVYGRVLNAISRQKHKDAFIPKSMVIEPTFRCNIHCADCYAPHDDSLMSTEMFESIILQAKKLGVYRFVLMGGEPTLPEVIENVLPVIQKHKHCVFTFCTNCKQINQEFIDGIKKVKNIMFLLSMEGTREATEKRRGKGSYEAYLDTAKLLRKNKMAFAMSITLEPDVWEAQIDEKIIEDFVNAGGAIIYSYPRFNNTKQEFYELPRIDFLKRIQTLCKKYSIYWGDGHYGKMKASKGIIPRHNNQVCINPHGVVRPYRFYYTPEFESVAEKPLLEILSNKELIETKLKGRIKANELLKNEKDQLNDLGFKVYDYTWRM